MQWRTQGSTTWSSTDEALTGGKTTHTLELPPLVQGTTYELQVQARNSDTVNYVNSEFSAVATLIVPTKLTTPNQPTIAEGGSNADGYALSWNAISNASGYQLQWRIQGSTDGPSSYVNTSGTSYTFTPTVAHQDNTLELQVKAQGDGTNYVDSDLSTAVTLAVPITGGQLPKPTNVYWDGVNSLCWDPVPHATDYDWMGSFSSSSPSSIGWADPVRNDDGDIIQYCRTYTNYNVGDRVAVTATSSDSRFTDSERVYVTIDRLPLPKLATPELLFPATTGAHLDTVRWNAVENAIGYEIRWGLQGSEQLTVVSVDAASGATRYALRWYATDEVYRLHETTDSATTVIYTFPDSSIVDSMSYIIQVLARANTDTHEDSDWSAIHSSLMWPTATPTQDPNPPPPPATSVPVATEAPTIIYTNFWYDYTQGLCEDGISLCNYRRQCFSYYWSNDPSASYEGCHSWELFT